MPKKFRSISLILVVTMLLNISVESAYGLSFSDLSNLFATSNEVPISQLAKEPTSRGISEKKKTLSNSKVQNEITQLREENVKTFWKDDKTYEAVVYPEPIHYFKNGTWKDIDNRLTKKVNQL